MRRMELGRTGLRVPAVALGCMRISGLEEKEASSCLRKCLELGINFFDHADIYGGGACEEKFARAVSMTPSLREKIILQSKCGICPGVMYDFSEDHIIKSVDGILKRLHTEYLDVLLLHRPDALTEPEEVAAAFDRLEKEGKVRHFGVSNHRPSRIRLLKKCVRQEIAVNQLQLSVPFAGMVAGGIEVNMLTEGAADRDGDVLDYCRLEDITVQAWSPFQAGKGEGTFLGSGDYPELNRVLEEVGERYGAGSTTVAAAWILRHPANIQLIAGTMKESRLEEIAQAADLTLSREEWYRIYMAAGHILP